MPFDAVLLRSVREELVHERVTDGNHFLYVEGLEELMRKCYAEEKILGQYPELEGLVKA